MADIKTHLREISVAFGIKTINIKDINIPSQYFSVAQTIIRNDISIAENIKELKEFNSDLMSIISNGIRLGETIVKNNLVNPEDPIFWLGSDTQKEDPVDLYVGEIGFSLKEDSFILENMGLYKYLNLITGSNYKSGDVHVFKEFAPNQYNDWFKHTWNLLIEHISVESWFYEAKNYEIVLNDHFVNLSISNKIISRIPKDIETIEEYETFTIGKSRKIFSKWIQCEISQNSTYVEFKKICAEVAAKNFLSLVQKKMSADNLARLLQIYPKSYYYAKVTAKELSIYYVPSFKEFQKNVRVHSVEYSIPKSQLNILTKIENIKEEKFLEFRNECRFSHGQFNGTPEAKFYLKKKKGNDLSVIYEKIL